MSLLDKIVAKRKEEIMGPSCYYCGSKEITKKEDGYYCNECGRFLGNEHLGDFFIIPKKAYTSIIPDRDIPMTISTKKESLTLKVIDDRKRPTILGKSIKQSADGLELKSFSGNNWFLSRLPEKDKSREQVSLHFPKEKTLKFTTQRFWFSTPKWKMFLSWRFPVTVDWEKRLERMKKRRNRIYMPGDIIYIFLFVGNSLSPEIIIEVPSEDVKLSGTCEYISITRLIKNFPDLTPKHNT